MISYVIHMIHIVILMSSYVSQLLSKCIIRFVNGSYYALRDAYDCIRDTDDALLDPYDVISDSCEFIRDSYDSYVMPMSS